MAAWCLIVQLPLTSSMHCLYHGDLTPDRGNSQGACHCPGPKKCYVYPTKLIDLCTWIRLLTLRKHIEHSCACMPQAQLTLGTSAIIVELVPFPSPAISYQKYQCTKKHLLHLLVIQTTTCLVCQQLLNPFMVFTSNDSSVDTETLHPTQKIGDHTALVIWGRRRCWGNTCLLEGSLLLCLYVVLYRSSAMSTKFPLALQDQAHAHQCCGNRCSLSFGGCSTPLLVSTFSLAPSNSESFLIHSKI